MIEFTHVLCPVDLSDISSRALAHAAALARWYGARLTVLHVAPTFDPVETRPSELMGPVRIVYPATREEVVAELERIAVNEAGGARDATFVAEAGDPVTVIVDQALALSADIVVMGTHGRRGFRRFVLGSVTEHLLREAPCPVLTVPPHGDVTTAGAVTFKNILCPIDFSPAALQAFGFAVDLAKQADGRVTLLHAIEWMAEEEPRADAHFDVPQFRGLLARNAETQLHALISDESRDWCDLAPRVVFGRAYRQILDIAGTSSADLIVMGAQGRGGVRLALFGSTTQQVVRGATCPVLTVRGAVAAARP